MERSVFIYTIAPFAVMDMMQSKVLASVTIAQAILESGDGRSAPNYNLFGIKATGAEKQEDQETKEYVNGKWITIKAGFRCYDSWEGSIRDHSNFLTVNGRYARSGFFDRCKEMDYKGAAQALQAAGYATDPNYSKSLIALIQVNNLYKFDKEAVSNIKEINELKEKVTALEAKAAIIPMPDWFKKEFGADSLNQLVHDLTGTADFWRNLAITIRISKL